MAKRRTTFTAIDPNGTTHTRTSDARTYTHTVVYQRSKAEALTSAKSGAEYDGRNYDYDVAKANGTHPHVNYVAAASAYHSSYSAEHIAKAQENQRNENARLIAAATAIVEAFPTKEAYVAAMVAGRIADVEATDFTIWHNLGWCGRPDLAAKLAAKTPGAVILKAEVKG